MENKKVVIYFGMDLARSSDDTSYMLFYDGQYKHLTKEEYWILFYEQRIDSEQKKRKEPTY